jgi:hypothetical protein
MNDHRPTVLAETIREAATDLSEILTALPVPREQVERVAGMLDRLSQEIAEAAQMLRHPH